MGNTFWAGSRLIGIGFEDWSSARDISHPGGGWPREDQSKVIAAQDMIIQQLIDATSCGVLHRKIGTPNRFLAGNGVCVRRRETLLFQGWPEVDSRGGERCVASERYGVRCGKPTRHSGARHGVGQ